MFRKVIALLMVAVLVGAPGVVSSITCPMVFFKLAPCFSYLIRGGVVPMSCCNGVRDLVAAAVTVADRRTTCGCLKTAAAGAPGLKPDLAASIPGKCGLTLSYNLSPNTDCSKVN